MSRTDGYQAFRRPALRAAGVILLLGLHFWLGFTGVREKSATFDEVAHVTGGYSYWLRGDYRLHPENGWLPQVWAALPLIGLDPAFPAPDTAWEEADVWQTGRRFFYESGNEADALLRRSRAMTGLFSLALGLVIFHWSRELFGTAGGFVSLALYCFSPAALAHGFLATSDMAAALFFLISLWAVWRVLEEVSTGSVLLAGLALAGLALSKMSVVLMLPVAGALIAVRFFRGGAIRIGRPFAERRVAGAGARAATGAAALACAGGLTVLLIWAAFGFRYAAFDPEAAQPAQFYLSDEVLASPAGVTGKSLALAREVRLLPEAYLYGMAFVGKFSQARSAFLAGENSVTGWVHFFPYAFLVKSPLALFPILLLAAAAFLPGGGRGLRLQPSVYPALPLIVFLVVYLAFSLGSSLNIGHRHLLPAEAALLVLAGAAAGWIRAQGRLPAALLILLLGAYAWESWRARPHFLAFFNAAAGGPGQGYRHLVDSSLDWGQDLPGLSAWLRENGREDPVYLAYFGSALPAYYGIEARRLPSHISWAPPEYVPPLEPGLYCVSATLLQGVASPVRGPWTLERELRYRELMEAFGAAARLPQVRADAIEAVESSGWNAAMREFEELRFARLRRYLLEREPDAAVGFSILIYRLDQTALREAVGDPSVEVRAELSPIES